MNIDSILKVVRGIVRLRGATDNTLIGNISDQLKVQSTHATSSAIPHRNRIDVASANRTTSSNSGTLDTEGFSCLTFIVEVTANSGTGQILDVFLETSDDNVNWNRFIQTKRFIGNGNQRFQRLSVAAKYYRYVWEISGTTPSFTFSVTTTLKHGLPRRFANKIQYSFDLTQAVDTTSETFQAADASNVSLVTIRGTDGGSGAQYKVQVSNDDLNWVTVTNAIAQNSPSENANTFTAAYRFYRLILTANSNPGTRVMDIFWACNS